MKDFNDFLNWDVKIAVKYLVPVTASAFPYPNMITLITLILAVAGVLVMPNYLMAGVTLFFLGRFLDNVDGERRDVHSSSLSHFPQDPTPPNATGFPVVRHARGRAGRVRHCARHHDYHPGRRRIPGRRGCGNNVPRAESNFPMLCGRQQS